MLAIRFNHAGIPLLMVGAMLALVLALSPTLAFAGHKDKHSQGNGQEKVTVVNPSGKTIQVAAPAAANAAAFEPVDEEPGDGEEGDEVPTDTVQTVSNASDVTESGGYWVVDIFLTEEDRTNGTPLNPQAAWDSGDLTEIIYERPDGSTMNLEPEGANALYWAMPTDDAQYAEGTHTIYYLYQGTWYELTSTFNAEGELVAVNGDPYPAGE